MIRSHPQWRPTLLHGVRTETELYYRTEFASRCAAYIPCISRDPAHPSRRVTDALAELESVADADFYLCGGNPMIRAARALLTARGVDPARIFAEPYFFW